MRRRWRRLPNETTPEDTATAPISLTIGDVETPATALTVTATSSNVDAGAGRQPRAERRRAPTGRWSVTPAANQAGTATITVTVSDGTASTPQTFTVTVTAVNDAPTLAPIATGHDDGGHGDARRSAFTIGDVETPATALTVTATSSNIDAGAGRATWC